MCTARCACQKAQEVPDAWEDPSGPLVSQREVIEKYRRGDMTLRLSLYMQHRELRGAFALLDKAER